MRNEEQILIHRWMKQDEAKNKDSHAFMITSSSLGGKQSQLERKSFEGIKLFIAIRRRSFRSRFRKENSKGNFLPT